MEMHIIDDLKKGIAAMLRPGDQKKSMEVGEAYAFYYKATLLPLIALIIVSLAFAGAIAAPPLGSLFGGFLGSSALVSAIAIPILAIWVLVPIAILINAGLYHVFGRWIGVFKGDFNNTLTATMFSYMPTTLFLFALIVPTQLALFPLFILWDLIVLLLVLQNLQKTGWNIALGVVLITAVVIGAIISTVLTVFAISFSSAVFGWLSAVIPHLLGNGGLPSITIPV